MFYTYGPIFHIRKSNERYIFWQRSNQVGKKRHTPDDITRRASPDLPETNLGAQKKGPPRWQALTQVNAVGD
jgi:hypothetical protein